MNEIQQEIVAGLKKFRMDKIDPIMEHDDETKTFRIYCLILYQKILNLMANELLNVKAMNLFRSLKIASDYVSLFQLKCNRKFCTISQSI